MTKIAKNKARPRTDEEQKKYEAIMARGRKALLCLQARRQLKNLEPITPEMADAIFWDENNNKPLELTRAEQAMLIVFGEEITKSEMEKTRQ